MDSFDQLKRYPLKLTQGKVDQNLIDLEAESMDGVLDPTARRIKTSLRLGLSHSEASESLEFLHDGLSVTTNMVEQGHGTGAIMTKEHELYIARTMCSRAVVHQCRALVGTAREEKRSKK